MEGGGAIAGGHIDIDLFFQQGSDGIFVTLLGSHGKAGVFAADGGRGIGPRQCRAE